MNQNFFKTTLFVMGTFLFFSCDTTGSLYKQAETRFFQEAEYNGFVVTDESLTKLPPCVCKYLSNCGWVDKPVPETFAMTFRGEFSMNESLFPWKSYQTQLQSPAPRQARKYSQTWN